MDLQTPESPPKKRSPVAGAFFGVLLWIGCFIVAFCVGGMGVVMLEDHHESAAVVLAYMPLPLMLVSTIVFYARKAREAPSPYFMAIIITLSIALLLDSACAAYMFSK